MTKIPVDKIIPNPEQPRRDFDPGELNLLAESIRRDGLILPIAVEETIGGYILLDGERRWRAAKIAGLSEIEASVRSPMNGGGSQERLMLALVANIQRSDLNPLEEAQAFARLRELGLSVQEICQRLGISNANVYTKLQILDLEPEIQEMFANRQIGVDPKMLTAIRSLPDASRVRIIRGLVQRNASNKGMLAACRRIGQAVQYRNPDSAVLPGDWSMVVLIDGEVPQNLAKAARDVCRKCVLFEHACRSTCRDCPGVDLLKRLVKEVE